ncbi:hypothetical protein [Celeribacter sp.]|uniref:hypothetical protein n=1 Tax=Celeribacter sp. TaxID=1890673 RepID=UPI003A947213
MKIALPTFMGEIPKTEPRRLPDNAATVCLNARLERGRIEPINATAEQTVLDAAAETFYLHDDEWFSWPGDADAAPGPVATDRLYITSDSDVPRVRSGPGVTVVLALAAPIASPNLVAAGTTDPDTAEVVIYAYTYVTSLGEESAPSPLSDEISVSPDQVVTLSGMSVPPPDRLIDKKRIYRSQTSISGTTDLYFVAEIEKTDVGFVHDLAANPMNEAIPSMDYDTPPNDMQGITVMPNGIMAAFSGRELLFCEPYQPHAWPAKYVLNTNDDIVGLAAFGSSIAVLTTGTPYVAQGLHPDSIAMAKLEQNYPCLAKRGIVDMGYAAVYPSTNGLVQISSDGAALISQAVWTRHQWIDLQPETFIAAQFAGQYVFSHIPKGEVARRVAIIDLTGAAPYLVETDLEALDLLHHLETGELMMLESATKRVITYDPPDGAAKSFTWRSKPFEYPVPVDFGAVLIQGTKEVGQSCEMRVYRDGSLTDTVTDFNAITRLSMAGFAREWEFELVGDCIITSVTLAGTPDEIIQ